MILAYNFLFCGIFVWFWWRGCGEKGTLLHCWWECKLVQPLWRTVWRFLKKLEIELPYDPAIPLLGIHKEETSEKSSVHVSDISPGQLSSQLGTQGSRHFASREFPILCDLRVLHWILGNWLATREERMSRETHGMMPVLCLGIDI